MKSNRKSSQEKPQKGMSEKERHLLNKLLPRMFKYNLMHIPESNESEVIVEPNRSVLGFKTNCYRANSKYLKDHISQEEFDRVVWKANKVIENEVMECRKRQHSDPMREATWFMRLAVTLTITGILFMAIIVYGQFSPAFEQTLQYVGVAFIFAAALFGVVAVFFVQRTRYQPVNFQERIWNTLGELMSEESKALALSGRPFLVWGVGEQFFWLSLSISYLQMPRGRGQ